MIGLARQRFPKAAPKLVLIEKAWAAVPPRKAATPTVVPATSPSKGATSLASITTTDGRTYEAVEITKMNPEAISFTHSAGVATIACEKLPPDLQRRFNNASKPSAPQPQIAVAEIPDRKPPIAKSDASPIMPNPAVVYAQPSYSKAEGLGKNAETPEDRQSRSSMSEDAVAPASVFAHGQLLTEELVALRLRAEKGDVKAQVELGSIYYNGRGVLEDAAEARKWYGMAAEQGDTGAQTWLGSIYSSGRGGPKDGAAAVKWFLKAAEQGDANAQNWLGNIYSKGRGVPKDDAEAEKWYRKAAANGDLSAQARLVNLGKAPPSSVSTPTDIQKLLEGMGRNTEKSWGAKVSEWWDQNSSYISYMVGNYVLSEFGITSPGSTPLKPAGPGGSGVQPYNPRTGEFQSPGTTIYGQGFSRP